jgi:ABC-type sugar transport system ATPase subunit
VAIVKRLLAEHCEAGGGAILVSHRLNEIRELCDTITVLRNGEAVAEGRIEDFTTNDLVEWVGGSVEKSDAALREAAHRSASAEPVRVAIRNLPLEAGDPPLSLEIRKGEIVGLGGLPDQGQDTILDTLFGLGEIRAPATLTLDGVAVRLRSPTDAVRAGIAYVSGDRDEVGFAIRAIEENLLASALNRRGRMALERNALRDALSALSTKYSGLAAPLNSLSGGNQQKVLLARCFLLKPKVLLAADPTKGIDVGARAEVHASIRRLAAETGTAVLFTSSDDRELASLCDRVLVMERRRIAHELNAGVDLDEQSLIQSYIHAGAEAAGSAGAGRA